MGRFLPEGRVLGWLVGCGFLFLGSFLGLVFIHGLFNREGTEAVAGGDRLRCGLGLPAGILRGRCKDGI